MNRPISSCTAPPKLYKYFSKGGLLRFLDNFTLRFTPPCAFNDPFEVLPSIKEIPLSAKGPDEFYFYQHLHAALAHSIGGRVGMLCLSETPLNGLMWGHYASEHKGGVIEFDPSHAFFSDPTSANGFHQLLKKVDYSTERTALNFSHFVENKMLLLNDHGAGWLKLLKAKHPMFYTKSLDWSYEQEWRLMRQLVDSEDAFSPRPKARQMFTGHHIDDDYANNPAPAEVEIFEIPADCVKAIYLGARSETYTGGMSPSLEESVWKAMSKYRHRKHIQLRKVRISPDHFQLIDFDLQNTEEVAANVSKQEFNTRIKGFSGIPLRSKS